MRRHVVIALIDVQKSRVGVRDGRFHEAFQVVADQGIRVFTYNKRRAGMVDEKIAQAELKIRFGDTRLNPLRDIVGTSTSSLDCEYFLKHGSVTRS